MFYTMKWEYLHIKYGRKCSLEEGHHLSIKCKKLKNKNGRCHFFATKIEMHTFIFCHKNNDAKKKTSYTRQGNSTVPNGRYYWTLQCSMLPTIRFGRTKKWQTSNLPKPSFRKVQPNSEPLKSLLKRPEVWYNTNKVSEN